jgi:hypothetical protein
VVFCLRDPIARLLSWYRYARAAARLPRAMGPAEYVACQRAGRGTEQPYRVLAQGRYAADLERYFAAFGSARVHVLVYEELLADPMRVLAGLAAFAGLDPAPLARPLARENAARGTRSPALHAAYVRLGFRLRHACATRPWLFAALRRAHRLVKPAYALVNARSEPAPEFDGRTAAWLGEYYAPSLEPLARLIGRVPPWTAHGLVPARRSHAS